MWYEHWQKYYRNTGAAEHDGKGCPVTSFWLKRRNGDLSKKKILIIYPEMIMGGSTTALIAFLNGIDKQKYAVDLQLYKNRGPLFADIPQGITLLPEAFAYPGRLGSLIKTAKCILTGALFVARAEKRKVGKPGYSGQVLGQFQAKHLSRKPVKKYDVAIGFMEGWTNRYLAYKVCADKKIGWMHNTFANIAEIPRLEEDWMHRVDKVIFVADNCTEDFQKAMPQMAGKAETVYNIIDSELLRRRAQEECGGDPDYARMRNATGMKLVTVCRLSMYHKGLDRIVWCAKKLKENGRDFLWTIVGDGPDGEKLKAMIEENNLAEQVVMIGGRLNPLPFIQAADIYCMPSRYEGKPMVVTESMILGTPPFVTQYLSAHEQIQNGVDGVVAENGDNTMFAVLDPYFDKMDKVAQMRDYLLSHEYGNADYMRMIEKKYLEDGE